MGKRKRGREGGEGREEKRIMEGVKPENTIHVYIHICIQSCIVLGTIVSGQRGKGGGRGGLVDDG